MQKAILAATLAATILISACSTTSTINIVSEETSNTTTTFESTTEITTEAITEETTEATTTATFPEDGLQMSIIDVRDIMIDAMGNIFTVPYDFKPGNQWFVDPAIDADNNRSVGIINHTGFNTFIELTNPDDEYYIVTVDVDIFEFDMASETYKSLVDGSSFYYFFREEKNISYVSAINKQYIISIVTGRYKDYDFTDDSPIEYGPPFNYLTDDVQAGYDVFLALE